MLRLVLKDFYVFKRELFFMVSFYIVFAAGIFLIIPDYYVLVCSLALVGSPMAFIDDFRKNWLVFLCSLPVQRRQIVISKHIWILIYLSALVLLFTCTAFFIMEIFPAMKEKAVELRTGIAGLPFFMILVVLFSTVFFIISFRQGTAINSLKIYFSSILIAFIPYAVLILVLILLFSKKLDENLIFEKIGLVKTYTFAILLILLGFSVSAWISMKNFKKRDL